MKVFYFLLLIFFFRFLGTCTKKGEKYGLALISQRICWCAEGGGHGLGRGWSGFFELPGKNKQDFIRESASHRVLMWNSRLLSEGKLR